MAKRQGLNNKLIQAYRLAIYRVLTDPPFDLRIDHYSEALADWHARVGVNYSALISAANPRSRQLDKTENQRRHSELIHQLRNHPFAEGLNLDPSGQWPDEPSVLIGGISSKEAHALAEIWGQNAWLEADRKAIPRLTAQSERAGYLRKP